MSTQIPLILDVNNELVELPIGDTLDLTGSGLSINVQNLAVAGGSTGQSLVTDGAGNLTFQTVVADTTTIESNISGLQLDVLTLEENDRTNTSAISTLNSNVSGLQSDVSTLQSSVSSINLDITSLQGSLSIVQSDISTEVSQRESAVTSLQGQIDSVLANTDATALNSLAEIVQAFQTADNDVNLAITTLATGAQSAVDSEVLERKGAIVAVEVALANEVTARTNGDTTLQNALNAAITSLQSEQSADVTALEAAIAAAQTAATAAVAAEATARAAALSAEYDSRVAGDDVLQGQITANATAITAEAASRTAADETLQNNINTVTSSVSAVASDVAGLRVPVRRRNGTTVNVALAIV